MVLVSATVNSLPQTGLLAFVKAEDIAKFDGSDEIFDTHQPFRSWLNTSAALNISFIKPTLEVSQFPMS